jgi:salicylate 5-hydroxylase small subunit
MQDTLVMNPTFARMPRHELKCAVEDLYAQYVTCLNEERFEEWLEFFTEDAVYKIISRENHDGGYPLAVWLCEGRGYLQDRVGAIRKTMMYGPRYIHRSVSAVCFDAWEGDSLRAKAGYVAIETLLDEPSRVFNCGRYLDEVVEHDGRLKFSAKTCVFDSLVIPNSLVYPL